MDYERLLKLAPQRDPDALAQLRAESARRGDLHGQALAICYTPSPDEDTWRALRALVDAAHPDPDDPIFDTLRATLDDAGWPHTLCTCSVDDNAPSAALALAVQLGTRHPPVLSVLLASHALLDRFHTLILDNLDPHTTLNDPALRTAQPTDTPLRGLCWRNANLTDALLHTLLERPLTHRLTALDLSHNPITDAAIPELVRAAPNLERLTLIGTHVGHASVERLLQNLPRLRQLDVRDTWVHPAMAGALVHRERYTALYLDEATAWCIERARDGNLDAIAGLFAVREDLARAAVLHTHLWPEIRSALLNSLTTAPDTPHTVEAILTHIPIASDALCEIATDDEASTTARLSALRAIGELQPARGPKLLTRLLAHTQRPLADAARAALERYDSAAPTPVGARGVQIVPCSQPWESMTEVSEDVRHCTSCDMSVVRVHDIERLQEVAGTRCAYFDPRHNPNLLTLQIGHTFQPLDPSIDTILGSALDVPLRDPRLATHHARLSTPSLGVLRIEALEGRISHHDTNVVEAWLDSADTVDIGPITLRFDPALSRVTLEGFQDARGPVPGPIPGPFPINPGMMMPTGGEFQPLGGAPVYIEPEKPSLWKRLKRFFGG